MDFEMIEQSGQSLTLLDNFRFYWTLLDNYQWTKLDNAQKCPIIQT